MKRFSAVFLAALLVFAAAGAFAAEITLKLGHIADPQNPYAMGAEKFAELVKEKTGGAVEIQIFPSSQLGNQRDLIEGLTFGTVDLTMTSTAVLGNFLTEAAVFDLPFIFRDIPHAYKALDTVGMEICKPLEKRGIKVLSMFENGVRHMTNNRNPIRKPEDVKGLKIRVMEQPIYIEMMKALDASPTPMAFGELFTALQQGVVDGQENPFSIIYSSSFYEVQKYLSVTGHIWGSALLCFNSSVWNKISEEDKAIVKKAADKWRDEQRRQTVAQEGEFLQKLKDKGMEVAEVDKAAFQQAVQSVWNEYEGVFGKELMDLVRKYGK